MMIVYHLQDCDQLYYLCDGHFQGDMNVPEIAHFSVIQRSVTSNSIWCNRKTNANSILNTAMKYIRRHSIGTIHKSIPKRPETACQVLKDIQITMLSDYKRYTLTEENLIGANPRSHDIHIDESKIDKRNNHRGRCV